MNFIVGMPGTSSAARHERDATENSRMHIGPSFHVDGYLQKVKIKQW